MPRKRVKFQLKMEAMGKSRKDLIEILDDIGVKILADEMAGMNMTDQKTSMFQISEVKMERKKRTVEPAKKE